MADDPSWAREVRAGTAGNFDALNARLAGTTYDRHLRFLNFGYEALEGEPVPGPRLPIAFPNKDAARLVFVVADDADLSGATVLDVGCGRGGALGLLARHAGAARLVGLDLSMGNVTFAAGAAGEGTAFARGSAEQLPFADRTFDVVFNLESSACYPSMEDFYREVARVVRPGGTFLYADLFPATVQQPCRDALAACGLALEAERDITAQVVRSRRRRAERQRVALDRAAPGTGLDEWVGQEGSSLFERLERGTASYLALRLVRTEHEPSAGPLFDEEAARSLRATAEEAVRLLDGLA